MIRCISLLLAAVAAVGCASSELFDQHFDAHRYAEAAQLLEETEFQPEDARALYRAGIIYALPHSPAYDPERARAHFRHLLHHFPKGELSDHGSHLLAMLDELERERVGGSLREAQLEREVAELTEELGQLRLRVAELEAHYGAQESLTELFRMLVDRLDADLRERDAQLRALRDELEQLKEIDFNAPGSAGQGGSLDLPSPTL